MKKLNTRWLLSVIFLIFATAAALFAVYFLLPGTSDSSDSENQNTHVVSSDFIRTTGFYFDTVVTITIYDSKDESLLDQCMELCRTYESLFSRTLSTSEIYRLNHGTLPKEGDYYVLSDLTADLIEKGLEYCRLSGGVFDITIAPVSSLWDFSSEDPHVPDPEEIENALSLVGWENVDLQGNLIRFEKEGMEIDLGGIAKGYIADCIKDYLLSCGVESALINLGGNVLCIGSRPDGTPFRIGIQKPFAEQNEILGSIQISDQSVVSSGTYERNFEADGTLYHHILNPKTGYPFDNGLTSVTILSEKSTDGDGLSTTCFALGLERGMELINSLPDVYAVFITEDGTLHYSDGMLDTFPFKLTEESTNKI